MVLDPSTLCARTTSGEAELATASQGLSLGQRRVLALLHDPVAVDELAQRHRLEPEKLARDLTRLAELRLIVLQRPSMMEQAPAPAAPRPAKVAASMAPVVIGSGTRRFPMVPLAAGAAALALAAGIWHGTRSSESTPASAGARIVTLPAAAVPAAAAPEQKAATLPVPAPASAAPTATLAATQPLPIARVARDSPPAPDARVVATQLMTGSVAPQKTPAAPAISQQPSAMRSSDSIAPTGKPLPAANPVAAPPPCRRSTAGCRRSTAPCRRSTAACRLIGCRVVGRRAIGGCRQRAYPNRGTCSRRAAAGCRQSAACGRPSPRTGNAGATRRGRAVDGHRPSCGPRRTEGDFARAAGLSEGGDCRWPAQRAGQRAHSCRCPRQCHRR